MIGVNGAYNDVDDFKIYVIGDRNRSTIMLKMYIYLIIIEMFVCLSFLLCLFSFLFF